MQPKSFLTIVVIIILLFLTGCTNKTTKVDHQETPVNPDEISRPKQIEPIIPKMMNPLTGLEMDIEYEKQRPIAVMIENEYYARPQSGLCEAQVVYEVLVEGGITRFLALFLGDKVVEMGPVRSARPYFLDYAMEYNSIYIHYGSSIQGYTDLKELKIDAINGIYDDVTFWRDRTRKEPHNAYTNTEKILKTSENKIHSDYAIPLFWEFEQEGALSEDGALEEFYLEYFNNYTVKYTYNPDKKEYERFINGKTHTDRKNGESIFVKNIIVQFAKTKVIDDEGRLDIKTVDSGKGYYISDGKYTEIEWQKDGRKERTKYTMEDGKELVLNPGNIWIQILPQWGKFKTN